jgi:spore maturation protein CgeB
MDILTVLEGPSWADHHIAGSLEQLGHRVTRFVYGTHVGEFYPRARHTEREHKNRELLQLATGLRAAGKLDLLFCYVYDDFLLPQYAAALAALGVPMVNFNVDMINQWYRQIRTARYFSVVLCAQRMNMEQLARHGARVLYFPMAARLPLPSSQQDSSWQPAAPVTFVGTPMPYRSRILRALHDAGVPLAVYGKYWRENRQAEPERHAEKTRSDLWHYAWPRLRAEGPAGLLRSLAGRFAPAPDLPTAAETLPESLLQGFVPESAMGALFANSRINLGFTRMIGDDPGLPGVNQVKLRDFEVPMAGGFYLVEEAPDYAQLFRPGVEIETWRNPGELLDKIRYYLAHEDQRIAIAKAGQQRAMQEHAWQHRFASLFAHLQLES